MFGRLTKLRVYRPAGPHLAQQDNATPMSRQGREHHAVHAIMSLASEGGRTTRACELRVYALVIALVDGFAEIESSWWNSSGLNGPKPELLSGAGRDPASAWRTLGRPRWENPSRSNWASGSSAACPVDCCGRGL